MRKHISKGTRFEIFKRDRFTCQYCGRKPPDVILHVDHVVAVKLGGTNAEENLLTSCSDCNLGKSATPLDLVDAPLNLTIDEERKEKLDQIEAYRWFLQDEQFVAQKCMEDVYKRWITREGQDPEKDVWNVPVKLESALRTFIKRMPLGEIIEAVDIAFDKFPTQHWKRFPYFCGTCWGMIKKRSQEPTQQAA